MYKPIVIATSVIIALGATSTGAATAADNAVGFSLAVSVAVHTVTATTLRTLLATGGISFEAIGASSASSRGTWRWRSTI